jgi:hypothetical protein
LQEPLPSVFASILASASMSLKKPAFSLYIGIDYSGAAHRDARLKGLQIAVATPEEDARLIHPLTHRHWSRSGLHQWLDQQMHSAAGPILIGIDHGFGFPLGESAEESLPWQQWLQRFAETWGTHRQSITVRQRRQELHYQPAKTKRLTDQRAGAKSVFHFDVPGSVATSTHAGLPWLHELKQAHGSKLHFWPFEGWQPASGKSVIAEIYPRLWSSLWSMENRSSDEHDAFAVAASLRAADADGQLQSWWQPTLTEEEQKRARREGWILGLA